MLKGKKETSALRILGHN